MTSVLLFAVILVALGMICQAWLLRQGLQARLLVSLGLLAIAMYTYAYALYGACHGEVNFLKSPFACTRAHPVAYNPQAWRVGRADGSR